LPTNPAHCSLTITNLNKYSSIAGILLLIHFHNDKRRRTLSAASVLLLADSLAAEAPSDGADDDGSSDPRFYSQTHSHRGIISNDVRRVTAKKIRWICGSTKSVGGHTALVPHSADEPGELSQWHCQDDSNINTAVATTVSMR